jgi:hypothetical protein
MMLERRIGERSRPVPVFLLAVLTLALAGAANAPPAGAEKRIALLVGNSTYRMGPLRNPANDARAMAAALRQLGFDVVVLENAEYRDFRRAIVYHLGAGGLSKDAAEALRWFRASAAAAGDARGREQLERLGGR